MAHSPETPVRIRRFYKSVDISRLDGAATILLDGRTARTPAGRSLTLPTAALATLIQEEWQAQGLDIVLSNMPATRLAQTALDGVFDHREDAVREFARFAEADLICYFAEHPASLVKREEESWGPLLAWAKDEFGLSFERTRGISHRRQPPAVLAAVSGIGETAEVFDLAALAFGAALFGSVILVLALRAGRINARETVAAARLDEAFQEEHWGVDEEVEAHAARLMRDTVMLEKWFRALA